MPVAVCVKCNKPRRWSNRRGYKLKNYKCGCGGDLKAAMWTSKGWIVRKMFICPVCKCRRSNESVYIKTLIIDCIFYISKGLNKNKKIKLKKGDRVCAAHDPTETVFDK